MSPSRTGAASAKTSSIETYRAKRNFTVTSEPRPDTAAASGGKLIFVVQKHDATRLHWDFRLEHGGVLWSWAVPKGPSLDPHDKRLAVHVEDHPREYAGFAGTIPEGQYGAGSVEIWDRGTWAPLGDAARDLAAGELKFTLTGERLRGGFVLVRLKPRAKEKGENWLLIKEHDSDERAGGTAAALEAVALKPVGKAKEAAPAAGARRGALPEAQAPQLATLADAAPEGDEWISEVKFDGYRLLAWVRDGKVTLMTRNGQDWTHRLTRVAEAIGRLKLNDALLDGELVALREDGVSSFAKLQAALSGGRDRELHYYLFDLLHVNGWDLRGAALLDRKRVLAGLGPWRGALRYSDHVDADAGRLHKTACGMGLEGIICKRADAPYKAGRAQSWLKVKCQGREEFVVLGWTEPEGSRTGFGALHLGFYDPAGALHYVGGVGTGFSARELRRVRAKLDALEAGALDSLLYAGDRPEAGIHWVAPSLVAEVRFIGWSGAGRLRHAAYLGLRDDKPASQVVRDVPDAEEQRLDLFAGAKRSRIVQAKMGARSAKAAVVAVAPRGVDRFEGVRLTHGDKELWPGITKQDLAEYWRAVAGHAVEGIARRPLALLRCPEGIGGEQFFQKHAGKGFPAELRAGEAGGAPYLSIDGAGGLYAAAQISAIELHSWGAALDDPLHPDRLVFDLDPGEGVGMAAIAAAALEVRERLAAAGLVSWCRTSGGKGLHVVAPLTPGADWAAARAWCRGFAEAMEREAPERYVASVAKKKRTGRILVDWLRNGLGSTAIASFSPRARAGAGVATPLAWTEVTARLDVAKFTLRSVPGRLAGLKGDPWEGFHDQHQALPAVAARKKAG